MQLCGYLVNHIFLGLQDLLSDNNEELLNEANKLSLTIKKVWKGIQDELVYKLVPQLSEFRGQSKCT